MLTIIYIFFSGEMGKLNFCLSRGDLERHFVEGVFRGSLGENTLFEIESIFFFLHPANYIIINMRMLCIQYLVMDLT